MISRLVAWVRARNVRRYWESQHLEFVRVRMSEDARWLAADPIASSITERYEKLASSEWYDARYKNTHTFLSWFTKRRHEQKHIEFLRERTKDDFRWLTGNPVDRALVQRYSKILSPTWYRLDLKKFLPFVVGSDCNPNTRNTCE